LGTSNAFENELIRLHQSRFSPATIHNVRRQQVLRRGRRAPLAPVTRPQRCSRPVPGDQVKLDAGKFAPSRQSISPSED
jgi:hypothetical protein